jgi:hypothetical protein
VTAHYYRLINKKYFGSLSKIMDYCIKNHELKSVTFFDHSEIIHKKLTYSANFNNKKTILNNIPFYLYLIDSSNFKAKLSEFFFTAYYLKNTIIIIVKDYNKVNKISLKYKKTV